MYKSILLILFISAVSCSFSNEKRIVITAKSNMTGVQTVNPTLFKNYLNFYKNELDPLGLNFSTLEQKANAFYLSRFGINFANVPLFNRTNFMDPYKRAPQGDLFLLSYNGDGRQGQRIVEGSGFPYSSIITNEIFGYYTDGRQYIFSLLFNSQYLIANGIGGSFGALTGGAWLWSNQITSFYGLSRYNYDAPWFKWRKWFVICAIQPSISTYLMVASQGQEAELTNRPILIDKSLGGDNWGIGYGSVNEYQSPTFLMNENDTQFITFKNTVFFPPQRDLGVVDDTCIPLPGY
jgi:hypothetical protein